MLQSILKHYNVVLNQNSRFIQQQKNSILYSLWANHWQILEYRFCRFELNIWIRIWSRWTEIQNVLKNRLKKKHENRATTLQNAISDNILYFDPVATLNIKVVRSDFLIKDTDQLWATTVNSTGHQTLLVC